MGKVTNQSRQLGAKQAGIETFRFISIVAVIVIHAYPTNDFSGQLINQLARFAVPYFFIISGYFFYKKVVDDVGASANYFARYIVKLAYIYAFWYVIFAYWPIVSPDNWSITSQHGFSATFFHETQVIIAEMKAHLLYYLLAGGRADHLWFLPSLGMAITLLFISIRLNLFVLGLAMALTLYIVALLLGPYSNTVVHIPLQIDGRNGPFFSSIFVFIGALIRKRNITISIKAAIGLVLFGMIIHLSEVFLLQYIYDIPMSSINYVLGTLAYGCGVALFAMAHESLGTKCRANYLGTLVLGVYTSHLLIIKWLEQIEAMPKSGIVAVLLVTSLSFTFVALASRVPYVRKVVS